LKEHLDHDSEVVKHRRRPEKFCIQVVEKARQLCKIEAMDYKKWIKLKMLYNK